MPETGLKAALATLLGERVSWDVPTARLSTLGVGGPALALARPNTTYEVAALLKILRAEKLPFMVIGQGSNLLFPDEGYGGILIQLGPSFQSFGFAGERTCFAGAAAKGAALVAAALKASRSGWECLAGIPCSLGGALVMNAGSGGSAIGDALERVWYIGPDGAIGCRDRGDLTLEYRRLLGLPEGAVIWGADFFLPKHERGYLESKLADMAAKRKSSQPRGVRSAGCFFKNPAGDSAGRLIDQCGFKGFHIGGAAVSEVHANFLFNSGEATAKDFLALRDVIVERVEKEFGVILETEVTIVGGSKNA